MEILHEKGKGLAIIRNKRCIYKIQINVFALKTFSLFPFEYT